MQNYARVQAEGPGCIHWIYPPTPHSTRFWKCSEHVAITVQPGMPKLTRELHTTLTSQFGINSKVAVVMNKNL